MLQCYILTLCDQTSRYKAGMAAVNVAHAEAMEECRTRHICIQVCIGRVLKAVVCNDMIWWCLIGCNGDSNISQIIAMEYQNPQYACKIWCHLHCMPLYICLPLLPTPPFVESTLPTLNKAKPHRNCSTFCRPTILLMKCNTAAESATCPPCPSDQQLIN